jgi:hypothetical protein
MRSPITLMTLARLGRSITLNAPSAFPSYFAAASTNIVTQARTMSAKPTFSAGEDEVKIANEVSSLLSTHGGRWTLTSEGKGLERSFRFKTFKKTWVRNNVLRG